MHLTLTLLSSMAQAAPTCAGAPVETSAFNSFMNEAEQAFASFDLAGFQDRMDQASFAVPCLQDPLSPSQAAQYHRLQGLRQFVAAEEGAALESFRSAAAAEPNYTFPEDLVPPGHAILDLYDQAQQRSERELPQPEVGSLWVDGSETRLASQSGPALVQVVEGQAPSLSAYLLPGDPLPYAAMPLVPVVPVQDPTPDLLAPPQTLEPQAPTLEPRPNRLRQPRFFVGLGMGAAALGTWALASQAAATYRSPQPTWGEAELRSQERLTNGLTLGAGVLGAASVGMMGSAVMVMRW